MSRELTAPELLDMIADGVHNVIAEVNNGRKVSAAQYASAFDRTYPLFFESFFANMAKSVGAKRTAIAKDAVRRYLEAEDVAGRL